MNESNVPEQSNMQLNKVIAHTPKDGQVWYEVKVAADTEEEAFLIGADLITRYMSGEDMEAEVVYE